MTGDNLKSISPEESRAKYLRERKEDASYATHRTISDATEVFVEWTESAGIEDMNVVSGRKLHDFKHWCKTESENNTVSLNGILSNVRRFLVFCVSIEAVGSEIPGKTPVPTVPNDEDVCYEKPTDEEVEQTLEYLRTYEYASRRHVEYETVAEIGCRMGAVRGLDFKKDVDDEEQSIHLRHRPEKAHQDERGTPLKNETDGERNVNVSSELIELIQAHLKKPAREDQEDKFGREPLLTTKYGRVTLSTFRRDFYKVSRPCVYSDSCPHGRDIETCDAANNNQASKCPSSYSPHPLRRWSIERQIDRGMPKEKLCDRVDVSVPILNKHYDTRSEERKREQRLKILEKLFPEYGDPDATIDVDMLKEDPLERPREVDIAESVMRDTEEMNVADSGVESEGAGSDESPRDDEETAPDESQTTFNEFSDGVMGVLHPGLWPVVASIVAGKWLQGRLVCEFTALASQPGTSLTPSADRAAMGATAYVAFVCLVSINLSLLGVPLTIPF